jgi:prepilin-type N-terminal cleavage/methylation domain-containing protein
MTMRQNRTERGGFTLTELMVAIAVTVVMLLAINSIFNTATEAISTGTGTGRIIQDGRSISEQLARDTHRNVLLGPDANNGAFLVIVQHDINMSGWSNSQVPANAQNRDGVYVTERDRELGSTVPVRSDQIIFFRDRRDNEEPLAPGNATS